MITFLDNYDGPIVMYFAVNVVGMYHSCIHIGIDT